MSGNTKMNKEENLQECGQVAMLASFFTQTDFDKQILNPAFRNYVLSQKNNLLKVLQTGFALVSTNTLDEAQADGKSLVLTNRSNDKSDNQTVLSLPPVDLGFVSAPTPTPTLAVTVPVASIAKSSSSDVLSAVRQICSEKTGYPIDFLESELDLEADLGVDTIKQMEIVAAVREHFSLPKKEGFSLKDVPTIEKLSAFVQAQL